MQQELNATPARDLRTYIATVRHQKWGILLVLGLTVAATIAFTLRETPQYTSEGRILVRPVGTIGTALNGNTDSIDMPTERFTASSAEVAQLVSGQTGGSVTPEALLAALQVDIEPETQILRFSYTDPDPARAQRLDTAFMAAYLQQRIDLARAQVEEQRQPYEAEIKRLDGQIQQLSKTVKPGETSDAAFKLQTALSRRTAVQQTLYGLALDEGSGGAVSRPANVPASPSSPSWPRNIILAIVIGLALGIGIASLREHLSERLKGSSDLEDAALAPVLAAVPAVDGWRKRNETQLVTIALPKSAAAEAYRTLRTNLLYAAERDKLEVIAVTSATLGEGKTTTASNLAVTTAQTGKRVIVVSCDLRKPRLHRFFGLTNDIGVTSILKGSTNLAEASQRPEGIDTLRVLASGPVPTNPAELLGSPEWDALLDELRLFADLVIVDTPPILAVSDTLILAPKSDGVVIVADAHASSKGAVEHTREQLHQVGSNIVGCVFNNFDPSQAKYYPYDKRYYYSSYGYYAEEVPVSAQGAPAGGNGLADGNGHKTDPKRTADDIW